MGSRFKDDTKDPEIFVTTWFLMVIMVFTVTARLGTKFHLFKRLMVDDLVMFLSLVFAIAQSITLSLAVNAGYGYHYTSVASSSLDKIMKSLYAASIFYILSLACSKLSLALFIRNITPNTKDKRMALFVELCICSCATIAIIGTLFQCSVPRTWDLWNGTCYSLAWRYFIAGSSIVTDLLLMGQAGCLLSGMQSSRKRRIIYAAVFLPRLVVPIATIVQIVAIKRGTLTADPTFDSCETTIIEGVIQSVSIMTACWGQLKPFLSWIQSNGLKVSCDNISAFADKNSNFGQTGVDRVCSRPMLMGHNQILVTQEWDVNNEAEIVEAEYKGGNNNNCTSASTHGV